MSVPFSIARQKRRTTSLTPMGPSRRPLFAMLWKVLSPPTPLFRSVTSRSTRRNNRRRKRAMQTSPCLLETSSAVSPATSDGESDDENIFEGRETAEIRENKKLHVYTSPRGFGF